MACTNYLSGKDGTLSLGGVEIGHIRNFNVDTTANIDAFATTSTGGWTGATSGVLSAGGTFEFVGTTDMTSTPIDTGDCIAGVFTPITGGTYTGSIVISGEAMPVDVAAGGTVVWSYTYVNDGPFVKGGVIAKSGS